jgi:phage terminase large subunit GpA-like protein
MFQMAKHEERKWRMKAKWVWISKASTVDKDGNLWFPATREEIRKFRFGARKVFLRKPPSVLHQSFAQAVAMRQEDEVPPGRPWKRREGGGG